MGTELARAARDAGARVTLIAANLETGIPAGIEVIPVTTVDDLEHAMDRATDVIIMAAAVSDFRVENPYLGKLSRRSGLDLKLVPTKDLIANYTATHPGAFAVCFALADERQDLETVSRQKLWDKGVSLVVGNRTRALGNTETEVLIVSAEDSERLSGSKESVAREIVARIASEIGAPAK